MWCISARAQLYCLVRQGDHSRKAHEVERDIPFLFLSLTADPVMPSSSLLHLFSRGSQDLAGPSVFNNDVF